MTVHASTALLLPKPTTGLNEGIWVQIPRCSQIVLVPLVVRTANARRAELVRVVPHSGTLQYNPREALALTFHITAPESVARPAKVPTRSVAPPPLDCAELRFRAVPHSGTLQYNPREALADLHVTAPEGVAGPVDSKKAATTPDCVSAIAISAFCRTLTSGTSG